MRYRKGRKAVLGFSLDILLGFVLLFGVVSALLAVNYSHRPASADEVRAIGSENQCSLSTISGGKVRGAGYSRSEYWSRSDLDVIRKKCAEQEKAKAQRDVVSDL